MHYATVLHYITPAIMHNKVYAAEYLTHVDFAPRAIGSVFREG